MKKVNMQSTATPEEYGINEDFCTYTIDTMEKKTGGFKIHTLFIP